MAASSRTRMFSCVSSVVHQELAPGARCARAARASRRPRSAPAATGRPHSAALSAAHRRLRGVAEHQERPARPSSARPRCASPRSRTSASRFAGSRSIAVSATRSTAPDRVRAGRAALVVALERRALGDEAVVVGLQQVLVERRAAAAAARPHGAAARRRGCRSGRGRARGRRAPRPRFSSQNPSCSGVDVAVEVRLLPVLVAALLPHVGPCSGRRAGAACSCGCTGSARRGPRAGGRSARPCRVRCRTRSPGAARRAARGRLAVHVVRHAHAGQRRAASAARSTQLTGRARRVPGPPGASCAQLRREARRSAARAGRRRWRVALAARQHAAVVAERRTRSCSPPARRPRARASRTANSRVHPGTMLSYSRARSSRVAACPAGTAGTRIVGRRRSRRGRRRNEPRLVRASGW